MNKTCSNCSENFIITPEDLNFYNEISPIIGGEKHQIPPPTFCAECRNQRRLAWRNERTLYTRKCNATNQSIVSVFSPEKKFPVYNNEYWYCDKWDVKKYAQKFDFNKSFFEQFQELINKVPQLARSAVNNQNCEFVNQCGWCKNCYLIFEADCNENCLYSNNIYDSISCIDMLQSHKNELCYECIDCKNCYNLKFSQNCQTSSDSWFLKNCIGCKNCFGSVNLRNKEYYILNKPYSKEEYFSGLKKWQLCTSKGIKHAQKEFAKYARQFPHKYITSVQDEDSTGDYLVQTQRCYECFDLASSQDCKFVFNSRNIKKVYDMNVFGTTKGAEFSYEIHEIGDSVRNIYFSDQVWTGCDNIFYSKLCIQNCHNLFGCVGLRNSSYCILNKQYSKEEYEELIPKIIRHMESFNEWGEFFPAALSPFGYNETVASDYYKLTKKEALNKKFNWSDYVSPLPQADKIIKAKDLPNEIKDIKDEIINNAIECEITGKPFKITKQELDFYRKLSLPLPLIHPNQRHQERMNKRNPRKLYHRNCMCPGLKDQHQNPCGYEIKTTYAPIRPEPVYCEKCYFAAVE